MTRSIGDFFAHRHGVTWLPEIVELTIQSTSTGDGSRPSRAMLVLATDGLWDLISEAECNATLWRLPEEGARQRLLEAGGEFMCYGDRVDELRDVACALGDAARVKG